MKVVETNLIWTVHAKQAKSQARKGTDYREMQANGGQQGLETPPHNPRPPTGLRERREGLAWAQEEGGPKGRPRGPLLAKQVGSAQTDLRRLGAARERRRK